MKLCLLFFLTVCSVELIGQGIMTIESLDEEINVNPHMVYGLEEDQWTLEEVLALDLTCL